MTIEDLEEEVDRLLNDGISNKVKVSIVLETEEYESFRKDFIERIGAIIFPERKVRYLMDNILLIMIGGFTFEIIKMEIV